MRRPLSRNATLAGLTILVLFVSLFVIGQVPSLAQAAASLSQLARGHRPPQSATRAQCRWTVRPTMGPVTSSSPSWAPARAEEPTSGAMTALRAASPARLWR